MSKRAYLWRNAGWHLAWYVMDMAVAIAGWVYGFGLTVQSWPVLIGVCIFARFFLHLFNAALMHKATVERLRREAEHG